MTPRESKGHKGFKVVEVVDLGGRTPKHNLDTEYAILAAILSVPKHLDSAQATGLAPEHFYADSNRRVYEAAVELSRAGTNVDLQTVAHWLKERDWLQAIGGIAYLSHLIDSTPAIAYVEDYCKIVLELALVRRTVETCQLAAAEGFGDVGDVREWVDGVEERLYQLASTNRENAVEQGYDVFARAFKQAMNPDQSGVPTGFVDVDERLGGFHDGELLIVAARPGMGKALDVDARVLTPTGYRRMGDLAVGDLVIGAAGQPTRVVGVFDQGVRETYRLTADDGASVVCDDEHLWLTRDRSERRGGRPGSVRTTRALRHSLSRADSEGRNHSIPYVSPVHFAPPADPLPLDPYVLGALLGDGSLTDPTPKLHNPEADVRWRVLARLPEADRLGEQGPVTTSIVGGATMRALRSLGLDGQHSWDKSIPETYLRAPVEARIELLRGLFDTDGYVTDPSCRSVEYSTASSRLADSIVDLVQALGGTVSRRVRETHYLKDGQRHEARPSHRLVVAFPNADFVPVSSAKHLAKWRPGPHRVRERFVASIEPAGRREVRCIAVDAPDALYVTEGCLVTHNTSFIMNVVTNVVTPVGVLNKSGAPVPRYGAMVFSLEMPKEQLAVRMMASDARVDLTDLRKGELDAGSADRFITAAQELAQLPIFFDDTSAIGLVELRSKVRKQQRTFDKKDEQGRWKQRIGLVVIDYLQLMTGEGDKREEQIASLSRGLKQMAKQLRVPVVALSQLNRNTETRSSKEKRPQLSDLRESGAIEQDADVVMFIFRPEYYLTNKSDAEEKARLHGYAEIIISKQRNGPTGIVPVTFLDAYTRFENRAHDAYRAEDD